VASALRPGGSTRAWRTIREWKLAENRRVNDGRCEQAIPGVCTGVATEVHHIHGRMAGDGAANLHATCKECNLRIGDPTRQRHVEHHRHW
jgi:hypothetical protein